MACGVPTLADLRLERAFTVEHLDAFVAGIGDVNVAGRVRRDTANLIELPLPRSGVSPGLDEVPVLGELGDAIVGTVAVRHVDIAGAVPGHIRRAVEGVTVEASAGIAATAAAATSTATSPFGSGAPSRDVRHAGRHACARTNADVLPFPAEHQLKAPVRIEFDDGIRAGVDHPDVVLRIDAHLLREVDRIHTLSDFLHELAALIELKEA